MRLLMVLRFYDPQMIYNHDRLEPVTVINFSEFERSFSPFHPSGDCRNRAGSASNGYKKRRIAVDPPFFYIPVFLCGERRSTLRESSAGGLFGVRKFVD